MPPEKSAFEQELVAQFIESGKDPQSGLQEAIKYVTKEQLAIARSRQERKMLQENIKKALEFSRISEQVILQRLRVDRGPGKYDFKFDLSDFRQKNAFLAFQEDVLRLLQLRYLHSPETLQAMVGLVEKGYTENVPVRITIEVEAESETSKRIRNIRIQDMTPKTEDTPPPSPDARIQSNLA